MTQAPQTPDLTASITYPYLNAVNGSDLSNIYCATLNRPDSEGGSIKVALKEIRGFLVKDKENVIRRFRQEISVWKRSDHPNVQPLLGICYILGNDVPTMVSPWQENGNLEGYLHQLAGSVTPTQLYDTRLKLLKDGANGLMDLHDHDIVHADIKPENVLIAKSSPEAEACAKLCDFGFSWTAIVNSISFSQPRSRVVGTEKYMAPELLQATGEEELRTHLYSYSTDVWAFGCLICSVFGNKETPSVKDGVLVIPPTLPEHLQQLVRFCCVIGGGRPPVSEILKQLNALG